MVTSRGPVSGKAAQASVIDRRRFLAQFGIAAVGLAVGGVVGSGPASATHVESGGIVTARSWSNSQTDLGDRLFVGDVDGDNDIEFLVVEGRKLSVYRSNYDHRELFHHYYPAEITRLIVGDFTSSGREHGTDQILAVLANGSMQWHAISDDRTKLWWGLTQNSFIDDGEHHIVGDFNGDGAQEVLVFDPASGETRLYGLEPGGFFRRDRNYRPGNLDSVDLRKKLLLAGNFNSGVGTDLLVVDRGRGQVRRYSGVVDQGKTTFWWAFTTRSGLFEDDDLIRVANIEGGSKDGIIIRSARTGGYRLMALEYNDGKLRVIDEVSAGQLPDVDRRASFIPVLARPEKFRGEPGGRTRHDIITYDTRQDMVTQTHARHDPRRDELTYWWSYTSNRLFDNVKVEQRPWAVILARFADTPGDSAMEDYFRRLFAPGSGGLIEYWQDVTLGKLDIAGSQVIGWVPMDIDRAEAGGMGRRRLIDKAVAAARGAGVNPERGFHSQMAVFTHDFSIDGAPPGASWRDPEWAPFWIDGSANRGQVSAPPHAQGGSFLAHEMGHGFGLPHDRGPDLKSPYGDPFSIMSATKNVRSYRDADWDTRFGPALSLPHLIAKGWMPQERVKRFEKSWRRSGSVTFDLAPLNDRSANANLGVMVPSNTDRPWNYYLEYLRPDGWNRGIQDETVVIRRMVPGSNKTPAYLLNLPVPGNGERESRTESSGGVRFSARRARGQGRVVEVTATAV